MQIYFRLIVSYTMIPNTNSVTYNCRWFTYGTNPSTGKEDWLFMGEYWKKDWHKCPDIF